MVRLTAMAILLQVGEMSLASKRRGRSRSGRETRAKPWCRRAQSWAVAARVQLLGVLRVDLEDRELALPSSRKARLLLAIGPGPPR
jgi:hypothetical protein